MIPRRTSPIPRTRYVRFNSLGRSPTIFNGAEAVQAAVRPEGRFFIFGGLSPEAVADKKGGRVRGLFLVLLGLVSIGVGGALYYGNMDLGSLTKNGVAQPVGNTWAYLPEGLGVLLIVAGIALAMLDRRKM
jgi:hypothetical protein